MKYLRVKNWEQFQHYKDRSPPWIKLETDTFINYDFGCLHDASKLLAVCIWTLASRYKDPKLGLVPNDLNYIKRQCNLGDFIQDEHLKELINQGYLLDASEMLADCNQDAIPETETYNKETERETEASCPFNIDSFLDKQTIALLKKDAPGLDLEGYIMPAYKTMMKGKPPPDNAVGSLRGFARKCYADYEKEHGKLNNY